MVSPLPRNLRPLFFCHRGSSTRFLLISRANFREKWINNLRINNASICARFSFFAHNSSCSLYSSLPLCSGSLLSSPSLCSMFQPRFSYLRSPLSSMTNPLDSRHSSSVKTERVVIKGRVQGVFYRNWAVENATQLGLKGWVRNRRDGSVEALFSGDSDKVQEMEERCRRGPPAAMVTGLQVFPCNDDPGTGFQRRPTV